MIIVPNIQGIELLRDNHAGAMQLKNGRTVNYGVIRIQDNALIYYTGKGLREMWKPKMTEEERKIAEELKQLRNQEGGTEELIRSGHIAETPWEDIDRINF
jgi:hypothetical protein